MADGGEGERALIDSPGRADAGVMAPHPPRQHSAARAGRSGARRWCALVLVLACAGALPIGACAAESSTGRPEARTLGIFEDVQYLEGDALSRRLDAYRALGVHWVRFQMIWDNVQPMGPHGYHWSHYDALVRAIVKRKLEPLAVLGTAPPWARPSTCTDAQTCAPASPQAFADFARAAAHRYGRRGLTHWEIWNEPNTAAFWKPHPDPVAYAALLKAAYPAIEEADPDATVISGGLAPVETLADSSGVVRYDPLSFLAAMYANGAGGAFDAVGIHPYTFPRMPGRAAYGWGILGHGSPSIRGLMTSYGDAGKQVWATEYGAPTSEAAVGGISESLQARLVQRAYAAWARLPWTGPMIWYSYRDRGGIVSDPENFFGLVRSDGTRKPAYFAYQGLAARAGSARAAAAIAARACAPGAARGEHCRVSVG